MDDDLQKLLDAGMPYADAVTALRAYRDNPEEPGSDGGRVKSVLEKED